MSDEQTGASDGSSGSGQTGWSVPGGSVPGGPAGGDDPSTVPAASPFQNAAPPPWVAPLPTVTGGRVPRRTGRAVIALIVVAGLGFLGLGVWFTSWINEMDPESDSYSVPYSYDDPPADATYYGPSGEPAPAVVLPPADAVAATTAIVELYQRVFQPGQSTELWNALITEPAGLQERIRPFGASDCAVEVQTVVTLVQFTGNDTARVQLRFEGPNVPEFGRAFLFSGGAERQADGAWKATPEAVDQVADLASGYCS